MAESFDPYLRWLGIRDPQRPPNHYRLLGLDLFEADSDIIAVAADRQMAHLRTFQTGQFAGLSQRVLNELAAARICLLKPEKKTAYDALLREQLGGVMVATRAKPQVAAAASAPGLPVASRMAASSEGTEKNGNRQTGAEEFPDFASLASASGPGGGAVPSAISASVKSTGRKSTSRKKSLAPWVGLAVAGVLLVVGVIVVQSSSDPARVASSDATNSRGQVGAAIPTGLTASPNLVSPKANSADNPAPKPATKPADPVAAVVDHGTAENPSVAQAPAPPEKSSPPEPPLHSSRDVALVDNPPQHDPDKSSSPEDSISPVKSKPPKLAPSKSAVESPLKPELPPVPDKEALTAADKTIMSVYKPDIDQANHGGPEAKAAMAKQLIARGLETSDNSAARYVLLTKGRDMAIAGGDVLDASHAVEKLVELYAMDRSEEQLLTSFVALAKTVHSRDAADILRIAAERAADKAISVDNFELAGKFARLALGVATKLRDPGATAELKTKVAEIDQCKKEYAKLSEMLARLRTDPDDAEANLALGRFLGFTKGDFDKAIPYLAKSSDPSLKELAKKDLDAPTEPAEQAKLGDAWWTLAEANHDPAKSHVQAHAATWYTKAAPKLKGLAKGEAESRLKEIATVLLPSRVAKLRENIANTLVGSWKIHFAANPASPEPAGFDYDQQFFEDGTWKNQFTTGHWRLDGDTITCTHNNRSDIIQKYQIVGGELRGLHYHPPDKPMNDGIGTKVR